MADYTISISTKPGIKCYALNNQLSNYDTVQGKLEKIRKSTKEEYLWTGESVFCICTHHVEQHCTIREQHGRKITIHCHGTDECCNCELFMTRSTVLGSHSSNDKTMTNDLADV